MCWERIRKWHDKENAEIGEWVVAAAWAECVSGTNKITSCCFQMTCIYCTCLSPHQSKSPEALDQRGKQGHPWPEGGGGLQCGRSTNPAYYRLVASVLGVLLTRDWQVVVNPPHHAGLVLLQAAWVLTSKGRRTWQRNRVNSHECCVLYISVLPLINMASFQTPPPSYTTATPPDCRWCSAGVTSAFRRAPHWHYMLH